MKDVAPIADLEAIDLLVDKCVAERPDPDPEHPLSYHGRCKVAAAHLTRFSPVAVTAQQLDQWRQRGAVAAHKRLAFLQAFNALPGRKLPMAWLATPAQRHNGGQSHGGKGEHATQKRKGKGAQGKRRRGARPQLGASAA